MEQSTLSYFPGEIPVGSPPELTPDLPSSPSYRPETTPREPSTTPREPSTTPREPTAPRTPEKPSTVPKAPDAPSTVPDRPSTPVQPSKADRQPDNQPAVRPDFDPDLPEKPGPPLSDPESPHGIS